MRVYFKTAAIAGLAILLLFVFADAKRQKKELEKTFEGLDRIKIETISGDCVIERSESNQITLVVISAYDPPESFEPRIKERGSTLYLSEDMHGSNSGYSTWILAVPDDIEIDFSSASGDLAISDVRGRFAASTASGDVEVERASGEYDFSTASGDVRMEDCTGEFDISTASGDIRASGCAGIFDLSSASGDVIGRLVTLEDDGEFSAASGDVDVRLGASSDFDISVGTASGAATLDLNGHEQKGRFEMLAKVRSGGIDCPFSFDEEETFERHGDKYVMKSFSRGGDDPLITISTASGEAELRQ